MKAIDLHQPKMGRIYYINQQTSKQERLFDRLYRDLKYGTRANDSNKLFSKGARLLLANVIEQLLRSPNKRIFLNHGILSDITDCQNRQNINLLKELAEIINFKYYNFKVFEGKRCSYGYEICFTKNGEKRVTNPELFYFSKGVKKCDLSRKKLRSDRKKISTSYTRDVKEGDNTINNSDSIIPLKEKINKKENTPQLRPIKTQNNTPIEPTQESQEQINQVEIATTLHEGLSLSQPDTNHKGGGNLPPTQLEPVITSHQLQPNYPTQQTRLSELRRKIAKTFGIQTAEELANKTTYVELTDHKLAVKLREGVKLTEYDKERLRDCINAVYGENVQIVTNKPKVSEPVTNCNHLKPIEKQKNEEPMTLALAIPTEQIAAIIPYTSTAPIWDKVRQALVYKHGADLVNVRFKRLEITEQDGIITFTGPLSSIYLIANNFDLKLMECSELYGVVFKLIGTCRITGEIEERIIKFWPTTSQNERN
jgi:hypothetical protein